MRLGSHNPARRATFGCPSAAIPTREVQPFPQRPNLLDERPISAPFGHPQRRQEMLIVILVVLLLLFGFGGYRMGPGIGYYGGGGISLILLIVIILLLLRVI
jgi:hypothetical protein